MTSIAPPAVVAATMHSAEQLAVLVDNADPPTDVPASQAPPVAVAVLAQGLVCLFRTLVLSQLRVKRRANPLRLLVVGQLGPPVGRLEVVEHAPARLVLGLVVEEEAHKVAPRVVGLEARKVGQRLCERARAVVSVGGGSGSVTRIVYGARSSAATSAAPPSPPSPPSPPAWPRRQRTALWPSGWSSCRRPCGCRTPCTGCRPACC